MAKLFSFRFDVDTHRCVREGMPALVRLGDRLGVPFTFFVNMGRAVSRRGFVRGFLRSDGPSDVAAKLSARTKLGSSGYLRAALLNPLVGAGSPDIIRSAIASGHEVGLHGGRNHAEWQSHAPDWASERVAAEVDAVLPRLHSLIGPERVVGFASPGWATPPALCEVLVERGFEYVADDHGPRADRISPAGAAVCGLRSVHTALTGEPGGVAYLEHLVALGMGNEAIVARFREELLAAGNQVVVYDHPYFAGLEALHLVEALVGEARDAGYEIVPVATIARAA
ncbi:MAG: polysaccharide deacetylase family protein [Gemmatimonadota bacterium]